MSSAPPTTGKTGTGHRAPFPHHYDISLSGAGPGVAITAGTGLAIEGGAPESFGGRDDWWSPEHLLLAAVGLCLKTTFDAFAAKEQLGIRTYASRARGVLDKTATGLAFTSLAIDVELELPAANAERARQILEIAKKFCIISNTLNVPIEVHASVKGV